MGRIRQGSIAKRLAICAFAIYALLLQGFLLASASAFAEEIICTQNGSNSSTGSAPAAHHHGLCCILACAAAGSAYTGTASAADIFFPRTATRVAFTPAPFTAARPHLKYHFAARGPPSNHLIALSGRLARFRPPSAS